MTITHHTSLMQRADDVPGPPQGEWTYEKYAAIPKDRDRYEVVRGVLYMAPAPNWDHQGVALEIVAYLRQSIALNGRGKVRFAPCDVQLAEKTIVQPDVLVVLNEHLDRIKKEPPNSRVIGAPDLVVEIFSPRTINYDQHQKRAAYESAGVPEYWLVDPETRSVELLVLEEGAYHSLGAFRGKERLPSRIVPDLPITVEAFFADLPEENQ